MVDFDRSTFPAWTPPDWDKVVAAPIIWEDRTAKKAHLSCYFFEEWNRVAAAEIITDYVFWSRNIKKDHTRADIAAMREGARAACERLLDHRAKTFRDRVRAGLPIMDPVPDTGVV